MSKIYKLKRTFLSLNAEVMKKIMKQKKQILKNLKRNFENKHESNKYGGNNLDQFENDPVINLDQ